MDKQHDNPDDSHAKTGTERHVPKKGNENDAHNSRTASKQNSGHGGHKG